MFVLAHTLSLVCVSWFLVCADAALQMKLDELSEEEQIGVGGFGRVFRGKFRGQVPSMFQ